MAHPNGVEIFPGDDNTQCRQDAVSQMPKSSVNEGVWPKVRQFRKEICVVLDDGLDVREGQAFDGTHRRRSSLWWRNAGVRRAGT